MNYNIAIDGPAGAGKSTIAKSVAEELNFIYVDTGAMYRAMALYFIRKGIDAEQEETVSRASLEVTVTIRHEEGEQQIILNGENVTKLIRTEEVGKMASRTSVNKAVRLKLVELQRELAQNTSVIMDGRDIGTYVLPNADLKIFLTASAAVRAKRRYDELTAKGETCNIKEIEADIVERDFRDSSRDFAPLRQAEDAVLVDSSQMTPSEVKKRIISLFHERI